MKWNGAPCHSSYFWLPAFPPMENILYLDILVIPKYQLTAPWEGGHPLRFQFVPPLRVLTPYTHFPWSINQLMIPNLHSVLTNVIGISRSSNAPYYSPKNPFTNQPKSKANPLFEQGIVQYYIPGSYWIWSSQQRLPTSSARVSCFQSFPLLKESDQLRPSFEFGLLLPHTVEMYPRSIKFNSVLRAYFTISKNFIFLDFLILGDFLYSLFHKSTKNFTTSFVQECNFAEFC